MPAPLLNRIPREHLPAPFDAMWDRGMARTGEATVVEVLANHPAMLDWYIQSFYAGLFYNQHPGMKVDVRSKELLRLKLSKQHGCRFCNRGNSLDALKAGITQAQIDGMLDPPPGLFDEKDQAILDLADEMMLQNQHGELTPDLYARLRRHYDDAQLVELGIVAAVLTGIAKLIFAYDLVSREETCPVGPAPVRGPAEALPA